MVTLRRILTGLSLANTVRESVPVMSRSCALSTNYLEILTPLVMAQLQKLPFLLFSVWKLILEIQLKVNPALSLLWAHLVFLGLPSMNVPKRKSELFKMLVIMQLQSMTMFLGFLSMGFFCRTLTHFSRLYAKPILDPLHLLVSTIGILNLSLPSRHV